jgi:hypothetical protein
MLYLPLGPQFAESAAVDKLNQWQQTKIYMTCKPEQEVEMDMGGCWVPAGRPSWGGAHPTRPPWTTQNYVSISSENVNEKFTLHVFFSWNNAPHFQLLQSPIHSLTHSFVHWFNQEFNYHQWIAASEIKKAVEPWWNWCERALAIKLRLKKNACLSNSLVRPCSRWQRYYMFVLTMYVCACATPHGVWFVSFGGCELSWCLIAFASLIAYGGLLPAQHQ